MRMLQLRFLSFNPPVLILFLGIMSLLIEAYRLPDDEVQALKHIAVALKKTNWNFNVDPCSGIPPWNMTASKDAISCNCSYSNGTTCHVTGIFLKRQSLQGTLTPHFARLSYLEDLDLTGNYLNGSIPSELGALRNLRTINLNQNRLTGPIPKEIGNISTLRELVVEFNQLSGNLSLELGNLSQLNRLLITSNYITGELPSTFANLTVLQQVRLGDNLLSGQIPKFIQNWKNLSELAMQGSGLHGPVPSGLATLENLTDLRITDLNGDESPFPYLGSGDGWKTLILRNCNLIGNLPGYLAKFIKLETLDVSFNKLSGEIPLNYSSLKGVKYMYLSGNSLTGQVPDWITNAKANRFRDLSYNNFTLTSIQCPDENKNLFVNSSGTNEKTRACSKDVCTTYQDSLHINCGGLQVNADNTTYNEDINKGGPSTLYHNSQYNWAYSSTGHFLDNEKTENRYIVDDMILSETTQLPLIYQTARLSPISLTFYGFCLTRGNYSITLHFAEIIFTRDKNYTSLGRRYFDVYIQGKLVLKDFNIEDAAGGARKPVTRSFFANVTDTLEIRFHWAGRGTMDIPEKGVYGPLISAISAVNTHPIRMESRSKISILEKIGIGVGVALFVSLISCVVCWKVCLRRNHRKERDLQASDLQTSSFTLQEIKAATDNFRDDNKIGEGGFGPVYKGILSDGRVAAVKQLSSKSQQGNREFLNEIGMISVVQHPNLVKLYGCCIEGNQLLLIYEFMENNSLAQALFEKSDLNLNWKTRHMICIGVARGLAFLHEESRMKIVHRDIKATNVLLDKNLNAKISDFGLAKLCEEETHISTRIAGTYGYMAPEYAMHGYLTDKADVYSFGILALEVISGRRNSSYKEKRECLYLIDWANFLKDGGKLMDLIDPRLGSDFNEEEAMVMIDVALLCTSISPAARPTMSSVVRMLEGDEEVPLLIRGNAMITNPEKIEAMRRHFKGCAEEQEEIPFESNTELSTNEGPPPLSPVSSTDLYPKSWNSYYWQNRSPS